MIHASRLMNKVPKVQVSDTTKFNRNLSAGYIKNIFFNKKFTVRKITPCFNEFFIRLNFIN